MDRKALGLSYWDIVFVSYVLTALAVSFAREDLLVENLADSGNRVLLQVTLLAFYAAAIRLLGVFGKSQTD